MTSKKLIIPTDDVHREIFKIKIDKGLKSANEVLKLLLETYFKEKIRINEELMKDNILNNNIENT